MTTDIHRRVAALEQKSTGEKVIFMYVSWVLGASGTPKRLKAEYRGEEFTQADGESVEDFRQRVEVKVKADRPPSSGVTLLWLDEIDAAPYARGWGNAHIR